MPKIDVEHKLGKFVFGHILILSGILLIFYFFTVRRCCFSKVGNELDTNIQAAKSHLESDLGSRKKIWPMCLNMYHKEKENLLIHIFLSQTFIESVPGSMTCSLRLIKFKKHYISKVFALNHTVHLTLYLTIIFLLTLTFSYLQKVRFSMQQSFLCLFSI